jgi:hypothetical protein
VRPDCRIFADLAAALECHKMNYRSPGDVFKDIRKDHPDFPPGVSRRPRRMTAPAGWGPERANNGGPSKGGFLLVARPGGYRHRGIDLASKVGGLGELGLEEGFRMNPEDLIRLGLKSGDRIRVAVGDAGVSASGQAVEDPECPANTVYFTRPVIFGGLDHRRDLRPLFGLEGNPVRIEVSRAKG